MEKEQIICKYKFKNKEKFNGKPYCLCHNELCEDLFYVCDHNCQIYEDYKQLARKTQECDFWKRQAELGSETTDRLAKQLEEKEQECEALKSEGFTRESLITLQEDDLQLAEQLIAGILKTLNLEAYDWRADQNEIITEIKAFKQECEELKDYARRQENQRETYYKEFLKKNKALEKIEQELKEDIYCESQECGCDDFEECLRCTKDLILDIINKAEGEG